MKPHIKRFFIDKQLGWGWGFYPPGWNRLGKPALAALSIRALQYNRWNPHHLSLAGHRQ